MPVLNDASGVRQHLDAFSWLTNTCFSTNRAISDSENQFATYAMEYLQSHGWNAKSMQAFMDAYKTFQTLVTTGRSEAALIAYLELKYKADARADCNRVAVY